MSKALLLVSNSTLHGSGYLDHCEKQLKELLGNKVKEIVFVPYARPGGLTHDEYTQKAGERFVEMGYKLKGIHEFPEAAEAIQQADAVFIGGGNSFKLIEQMHLNGIIEPLSNRINEGMPYIGTSAGSNVACPTIMTTNDMPICSPPSFEALNVFPYQINAHYIDPDPESTHKGETRDTRIKEYHFYNTTPVIGLREGCMIHIQGDKYTLMGSTNAKIFLADKEAYDLKSGEEIKL
jgi:dipeptidase E